MLPKAKFVSFLDHLRIFDYYVFVIGYMDGEIEIRESKGMKNLFQSGEHDGGFVKKCSVYSRDNCLHMAVLLVSE